MGRARMTALAAATAALLPFTVSAQEGAPPGKDTYDRWCATCHGAEGAGDGAGAEWMLPRPRDFTTGLYQVRTTLSGELPTDADIRRVIDEGMPGTTMPGWAERLSQRERDELVDYVKSFSRFFGQGDPPEPIDVGRAPGIDDEGLAEGREFYERIECNRCHGEEGRGDGPSAPTLEDDFDRPVRAADLTENWRFNGGGSVEEIFMRLRTGLNGTPMPGFSDLIDAEFMTEAQLWNVAHYVRSLAPERPPAVTEVIGAPRVEEGASLPSGPDDEAWAAVPAFRIPMAGQIIVSPRWFQPRVTGLWVQALHDDTELALRVSWSDPSESPDPAWTEWKEKFVPMMAPGEGEPIDPAASLPDRLVVQFPPEIPDGMDRPYFLMGDARTPVYLWDWEAGRGVTEAEARGIGTAAPQESPSAVAAQARWEAGEWAVVFRRSLITEDDQDLPFAVDRAVPIAFSAWDGDSGEAGPRRAISSWYFIFLEPATPATVFVAPLMATLLTAGLGLMVVARAQKRERESLAPGES